ncbi:RagB/SusD family nutrient uptake outer membrane protein [Chryseobacterium sp. CFBP8996]|uniref:RagB/SusD family nutrient uptake outer membrane protein n=1 Tax=Chryseobacterium sp. CFBP8996 TaxID=3096529 RepID=UPI002A69D911|nr:RagB/SusD family nutrient uptake outer membrane protein [Chryseobacterium sp. CFBP8996]MDY0930725.1 RagB/SusD family nutrient uptake outer membrane protein [Chryseobacterium sp. CFBP8996]
MKLKLKKKIMNLKIKYGIAVSIVIMMLSMTISCEKMIETDYPNNQIPSELVFEDEQTAEAALAGLYSGLWETSMYSGGINGMGALLGTYTDDLTCVYTSASNGVLDLYINQQLPTNTAVTALWTSTYQQIYYANSIMEGVANSKSLSVAVKDRIRGEALLVRSMLYMDLYQIFGEIPYTATTDYVINSKLSRMPKDDFLTRVETDLSEAVNLLPSAYRNSERIYPNKYAGYVALARMKMLLKKWNETDVICTTIVQAPGLSYQNDISKVFQKTGGHIIWQLKPKNSNDATKEASLYNFTSAPTSFAMNPDLVNSFSTGDLRRVHYFTAVPFGQQINYKPAKYKNLAVNNATEYSIIYRLDEVYFMQAESLLQQNKVSEAVVLINRSRQRAGLPSLSTNLTVSAAMVQLKEEKRREFFTEHGMRFFDLKRWGMLDGLTSVKPNWKSFQSQWPIPQKELLVNPNINPQNNGY